MICIILTRVYYCWGLPSSFEGYFVLPAAISLIPGVPTHRSLTYSIGWFVDAQHTREHHHLNFRLSFHPPASPPEELECRWQEAQAGHFTLGVSYFAGNQNSTFQGESLFFFFFACLHCLKADPPQRQIDFYSLYLLISKEKKAARVQRACARRNNTQGNCFFKIKCRE